MPNIIDNLIRLLEESENDILDSERPSPELMAEIENVRCEIEDLFQNWEPPAEGIAYAIDELDENFEFAAEEFLRVCDLMEEALIAGEVEILDQAARYFRKARLILKAAEQQALERFASWTNRANPPRKT